MIDAVRRWVWSGLLIVAGAMAGGAAAAPTDTPAGPTAGQPPAAASAIPSRDASGSDSDDEETESTADDPDTDPPAAPIRHPHRHGRHSGDLVSIGHDSTLPAGERAESVVSVLGSSTSNGDASEVVSILGNTRVTGSATDSAVAVLGNTYVDGKVGDAVAVVGNVELGPHAEVDGDVTAVLGTVVRDPAAVIHGGIQKIDGGGIADLAWLHAWLHECLFYGRPLALQPNLGWAWGLALGYLAFYCILALLFRSALSRCVNLVDTEPGRSALTALVALLLVPVAIVLLCVTLIGIAAVPFVVMTLFCAGLFGKAVMLAWVGQRVAGGRLGPAVHPGFAVLLGGAVVLLLYCVPFLGFLVYQLLGFFGFGAVLYALITVVRSRQASKAEVAAVQSAAAVGASTAGASATVGTATGGTATADASTAGPDSAAASATAAQSLRAPPPPPSASLPRAGFWVRMTALLLDTILVGIVLSLLHPLGHFHLLVLAAYGAAMWKTRGATVGGLIFDLHVVRLDGRSVDWETAIVRALGCFLSLAVAGLGFIWIAFDPARQAWHDKIAGTVVVRVPKR